MLCAHPQGWVSGADHAGRKTILVLFINGRTVECSPLKRALEATYATILPKALKPFVYLVCNSLSSWQMPLNDQMSLVYHSRHQPSHRLCR